MVGVEKKMDVFLATEKFYTFGGKEYPVYTMGSAEYIALDNTGRGFCGDKSLDQLRMVRLGDCLSDIISASSGERHDEMKARSRDLRKKIVEQVGGKYGAFFRDGTEGRSLNACKKGGEIMTMGMFKRVIRAGGWMDDRVMNLGAEIYNLEGQS